MRIKGHTDIILTNVKTGAVERISEDNMITNAMLEYFANCGFLNAPNVDQDNMVVKLLGGVMAFNDSINEDATIVHAPAGLSMTANGSVGTDNDSEVLELGSFSDTESGWQTDGSFIMTFDYATTQANGDIGCVCLTGQDYGYVGEGNALSVAYMGARKNLSQHGTSNAYTIKGVPCRLNIADSSVYGIDFSDIANSNIIIRKYRLPLTKVNLKGTKTEPIALSETTITAPNSLVTEMTKTGYVTLPSVGNGAMQDIDGELMIFARNDTLNSEWGSGFTQYLWEIDPVNATVTESTLANTSGETLHSIKFPVCMSKNCIAWIDGWDGYSYQARSFGLAIFSMKRTNGTWSSIRKCENPIGQTAIEGRTNAGWLAPIRISSDKAVVSSGREITLTYDYELNKAYPSNGLYNSWEGQQYRRSFDKPLVRYVPVESSGGYHTISVMRDETYIASINNLSEVIHKTAEKTMKIVYRLEFLDS